eukprot:438197-Pyramimonas_sp.AAC.1
MADSARGGGERAAREQAARENHELRSQLEDAALETDRVKPETLRAPSEEEHETQATREEDHEIIADALEPFPGQAQQHIRNGALATRA